MFPVQPLSICLALLAVVAHAIPLSQRDVIVPKITSPTKDSVWPIGSVQTVTWDTSNFPPDSQITNPIGRVLLGFDANDSLNLDIDHPLAQGFKLRDGSVQVTVPNVAPMDNYLIVLMGDSGNASPTFAITRITNGTSTTTTTSTSSSSSSAPAAPPATSNDSITPPTAIASGPAAVGGTTTSAVDTTTASQPTVTSPTTSAGQSPPSTTDGPPAGTGAATSIRPTGIFGLPALCAGAVTFTMLLMV